MIFDTVRGENIATHHRKSRAYDLHRTCAEDSCGVLLSRYNPGKYCSVHGHDPQELVRTMKMSGGRRGRAVGG
jgi:hypothetical protein